MPTALRNGLLSLTKALAYAALGGAVVHALHQRHAAHVISETDHEDTAHVAKASGSSSGKREMRLQAN